MSSSFILLLVLVFVVGAMLAAWAGIRSIQSARTVVFYRTRKARMLAGWQWLSASLVLVLFAVSALFFSEPVLNQILSLTAVLNGSSTQTLTASPTPLQSEKPLPSGTVTRSIPSLTQTAQLTATISFTPSRTPVYAGTHTAFAIWTERRGTFIAMLSFTPTASRTSIPTWTRTPSNTPRPTYTASATRTPRTPPPTWTPSRTQTPRPTLTLTPTSTHTLTPTRTATPTPE